MLATLLAFDIIPQGGDMPGGGDTGTVIATPARTAVLAIAQPATSVASGVPLGATVWSQPFDPADHVPFAIDFAALLDEGEAIVEIEAITMSAAGAALGVAVDDAAPYGPIIDTAGKKVQLWFVVDDAHWSETAFSASGVQIPVAVRVATAGTPPKRFERTCVLMVRQL